MATPAASIVTLMISPVLTLGLERPAAVCWLEGATTSRSPSGAQATTAACKP
jgi:hypothetical protein